MRVPRELASSCCQELEGDFPVSRRAFLAWLVRAGVMGLAGWGLPAWGQGTRRIRLGFCGQLLCVVPYEVARFQKYFAEQGLEVELVYFRGGTAAMQALVGGAVDYAATSFDVALAAFARGARIVRFFSTGRLPLFALATAPRTASAIRALGDLEGRTVGVSGLGNADHALALYLLRRAGVRPDRVQFAVLGPNLFDALRVGHVDAGMVQEPALTLIERAGGRVLVNLMDLQQAERFLGGPYEFMGVAVRRDEWSARLDEMRALARALTRALRYVHYGTPKLVVQALPRELIAGGEQGLFERVLARHRRSLYPQEGRIDLEAVRRVAEIQRQAGLLPGAVRVEELVSNEVVGSL
ncbi:MAG: ABC transporter substrate-binding protein [Armatimonadota bacterium]|nr:ABC transporter substrate-binding protein [Armatimonadota bacterium]MDR7444163.1 ABC transporter substrate-binding protein [Armatimonadota bacterium]MDR7570774.1 ABC transporter substrate-binding protein [Armatimonadota bacterium]MDR7614302.1 ABC transporter substrate-binding protein [Armatimonadota bacterium]